METAKTSNFTCQSKSFISIFFTCQVSACELQPFSCHDLANDIYSQTIKTMFSHLNIYCDAFKTNSRNVLAGSSFCSITEEMNAIQELRLMISSELERMKHLLIERRDMLLAGVSSDSLGCEVSQKV